MAHVIMEAKKLHDRLSGSWRTRKAGGLVKSVCGGLRTRSTDVRGQKKMDVPGQAEGANLPFLCLFVLFGPPTD